MSEDQLLQAVTELARILGLLAYHTRDSRRSAPGFPDLVLAGRGGVLFVELKSQGGQLSAHQQDWRYMLQAAGQRWRLWRPADLEAGLVCRELRAIA